MPRGLLIALLGSLLFPAIARGEPPDPPLIDGEVLLTLDSTADSAPTHALLSPNGDFAFIGDRYDAINVWGVLVSTWPVWLAVFLAPLCLWLLWRTWRLLRQRPVIGEPYCLRCGYCLRGVEAASCPECGAGLNAKAIAIGRPVRWRAATTLAALIALPTAFGLLYQFDLPRRAGIHAWFDWPSRSLVAWVPEDPAEWLGANRCQVQRVRLFDLSSGRFVRTTHEVVAWDVMLALTPTGDHLVVTDGARFSLYDVAEARTLRTARVPDEVNEMNWCGSGFFPQTFISHDGRFAFTHSDVSWRWDLATGELTILSGIESMLEATQQTSTSKDSTLVIDARGCFANEPDGGTIELLVRDSRGQGVSLLSTPKSVSRAPHSFSPDGERMYMCTLESIDEWMLREGRKSRSLAHSGHSLIGTELLGPVNDWVFIVAYDVVEGIDLRTGRGSVMILPERGDQHIDEWTHMQFFRPPQAAISADRRYVMVPCWDKRTHGHRLRIVRYEIGHFIRRAVASR